LILSGELASPRGWGKLLYFLYQAAGWIVEEEKEVMLVIDLGSSIDLGMGPRTHQTGQARERK
jgi:hypothetical protein